MEPKKVFLTFGLVFALFVIVCVMSLASAKANIKISKEEPTSAAYIRYELPKFLPAAWLTGN